MRGNVLEERVNAIPQGPIVNANDIPQDPTQKRTGGITLGFVLTILAAYLVWDVVVQKNKRVGDVVDSKNISTNVYNIFAVGFAALIFFNLMKAFLVKIAAWNIPVISWIAERALPLFQI